MHTLSQEARYARALTERARASLQAGLAVRLLAAGAFAMRVIEARAS